MAGELEIVLLDEQQLERANAVYDDLDFLPSAAERDETLGALSASELVALGRLSRHMDGALEVGGFWVRPDHRGRGLARRLVAEVIERVPEGVTTYCLPFDELVGFYGSFGMERVAEDSPLPASIAGKRSHCKEQERSGRYGRTTVLAFTR